MIICFNCSKETKKLLDGFVAEGEYSDYGEVITLAIENLNMIRSALGKKGSMVLSLGNVSSAAARSEGRALNSSHSLDAERPSRLVGRGAIPITRCPEVPAIFKKPEDVLGRPELMPLPDDRWTKGEAVPLNRWLFAMYNKILPAKVNCRALSALSSSTGNGVDLTDALEQIAGSVLSLGDYLAGLDTMLNLNRDNSLATAFPTSTGDVEKGISRYSNQFIASMNKYGKMSGMLVALKLINHKRSKKGASIYLTEPGWQFAQMENPILDAAKVSNPTRFSDPEIEFLLKHISENVPAEDSAYKVILALVLEKVNTPEKIDKELQLSMSDDEKRSVSESFLISQRSGAVSRMSDLGLLQRVRNGVTITYELTQRGRNYLSSQEANQNKGRTDDE